MFYYAKSDIIPGIEYNSLEDILHNYTDLKLIVFGIGYNVIRITNGFANLAFSFS
jgi:hypothetical protein